MFMNAYTFLRRAERRSSSSHIMFSISFVAVTVARVQGLLGVFEEAAQDLGADPLTTFGS